MEFAEIVNFITGLPGWAWFVLIIGILFITGDKKEWDFEVKFPFKDGIGRGEVELECLKKKGSSIEVELELEPDYNNKKIEIFLNNALIYTIPQNINTGKVVRIDKKTEIQKPAEGDDILIKIGGEHIFSGQLVLD